MNEKKIKFLQEINNGKIKGAQKLLAHKLKIAESTITLWFKGDKQPSLDNILKMAKVFNKAEKEIENIFSVKDKNFSIDTANFVDIRDFELIKEKIKRFETEIILLKKEIELLKELKK